MFAMKVPSKLKRTMEVISKESGHPLSKVFFKEIQTSTHLYLGAVLLHNLDIINVKEKTDPRELKNLPHLDMYFKKRNITSVHEFISLMESAEVRSRMMKIFPGLDIAEGFFSYDSVDVRELCRYVGKRYQNTNKDMVMVDLDAVKDIFLDVMLKEYFNCMAVGTKTQLDLEWSRGQGRMELLKRELLRDFDETFQSMIVEPIIVEEEMEEVTLETTTGRKRIPAPGQKAVESSKKTTKKRRVRSR